MDCYIIASTLEGGWVFSNYKKKDGLTKEEEEEEKGKEISSSYLFWMSTK
jgi:hypothetical protein